MVKILKGIQPGGELRNKIYLQMQQADIFEDIISQLLQMDKETAKGYDVERLAKSKTFLRKVSDRF